jgi:hypothetical protein
MKWIFQGYFTQLTQNIFKLFILNHYEILFKAKVQKVENEHREQGEK